MAASVEVEVCRLWVLDYGWEFSKSVALAGGSLKSFQAEILKDCIHDRITAGGLEFSSCEARTATVEPGLAEFGRDFHAFCSTKLKVEQARWKVK